MRSTILGTWIKLTVTTMTDGEVDLFVIGGGSGGVRAARIASSHGARVMLAEEYRIGGTCVIRGCVPKKLLVYASRFADEFEDAEGYGWKIGDRKFDWATLIANKDREIARLESAYTTTLDRFKVRHAKTRAVLHDANTVRLVETGELVRAKTILVATGGRPNLSQETPGIEHAISSNDVFRLETLPGRIVIQGGGYTAVEFAGIFSGLGSDVTLVYRGENILRGFDDDIRRHLRAEMERRGIKVHCGMKIASIAKPGGAFEVDIPGLGPISADKVLFSTGRTPNVTGMGLEKVGVDIAKNGGILVDEFSRTSIANIYAVGDVTNRINLTPVAIREGHAFADTVFGGRPTPVDHRNVPTAVFADPEVGTVGLTEAEAVKTIKVVDIYKTSFRPMRATLSGRDTRILMKLVVDGGNDRIVGCHIVGPDAAELIQVVAIAVRMNATKADFDSVMAVHPTAAEELVTMREKAASYGPQAAE